MSVGAPSIPTGVQRPGVTMVSERIPGSIHSLSVSLSTVNLDPGEPRSCSREIGEVIQ